MRTTTRALLCFSLLGVAACSRGSDAGAPDLALAPYPRTLLQRALMPTSPNNLLRDPFIDGDAAPAYGQFSASYLGGGAVPIARTFRSASPVGGAASIAELRDLPDAGAATIVRVAAPFLGGPGQFSGSLWISAGDASATPVPFATAAAAVTVTLTAADRTPLVTLAPSAAGAVSLGGREWVQLVTPASVACPAGGWLVLELADLAYTLQLAAPEVVSSALTP